MSSIDIIRQDVLVLGMDDFLRTYLPIGVVIAIVLAIIFYAVILNKKLNSNKRDIHDAELEERRRSVKVTRVTGFIPPKNSAFFKVLKMAMPANYIIIPNIAVELLFQRMNRKDLHLEGQYASFGVFAENFAPILVINLNDYSVTTDSVFSLPDKIKNMLVNCGVPVLDYDVCDSYSIDELRRAIAKAMNPLFK